MNINGKKLFFFTVIAILVAIFFWPDQKLKVKAIENGNTLVLSNGANVKLLGIASTVEAKDELESIKGLEVELVPDQSSYFDVKRIGKGSTVYAYVVLPKNGYECVNATILKKGASQLVDNCNDSLKAFTRYAQKGKQVTPTPPRVDPEPNINYSDDDIILPQYTPMPERKHSAWYTNGDMNLDMLEEACDYNLPYTKSFADQLAARSPGNFNMGQVCEIFDYCYNKWRYVNDPADTEYVARASESIAASLTGDCDDFAVLMASCILAVGGRPCINTGHNSSGGHAFAEVDIANFSEGEVLSAINEKFPEYNVQKLNYRTDGQHKWLNLDWQAAHPGGKYYDCSLSHDTYPYENGKWKWKKLR